MPARTPADLHPLFQHAFNAGDLGALVALYEPGAVFVSGGRTVIGRENIRKAFEELLPLRGLMSLETRTVIELQECLALLHGSWIIAPRPGATAQAATRGRSAEVVRKQHDRTWLYLIDNSNVPE